MTAVVGPEGLRLPRSCAAAEDGGMGEGSGGGGGERERKRVAAEVGAVDPDSVGAGVVAAARGLDRGGVLPWSCGASACAALGARRTV